MPHPNTARLRGLMPALITPFERDGTLALQHLPALMKFQRAAGMDGLVICGTNGEGTSLSVEERKQVLACAAEHRGNFLLVAGTGAANLPDALELTRCAAELGYDAALVLPPFFYKTPTPQGLAAYFHPILDSADLPLLLYHIPQFSAVAITGELLTLLDGHPNLAGIKDSTGDWNSTGPFIRDYPQLKIFSGSDRMVKSCLQAGGAGAISGGANAFPELVVAVRNAFQQQPDGPDVQSAQERLSEMSALLTRYPVIGVSKSILANRGLPRLGVRAPLVSLSPAQEEALLHELRGRGFLDAATAVG